jgi:hypothetical protein
VVENLVAGSDGIVAAATKTNVELLEESHIAPRSYEKTNTYRRVLNMISSPTITPNATPAMNT